MSDYVKLMRIVDREVVSINELRQITNDELVTEVRETAPDKKHKFMMRYEIRLTNGEIYYLFVKKPWYMILSELSNKKKKYVSYFFPEDKSQS